MRAITALVFAAFPVVANCAEAETPATDSCVAEVDALLDERAEVIPAMIADLRERYGNDIDSPEARGAYAELAIEIDSRENMIHVLISRCPEAARREVERRREIPMQVQIDD